MPRFRNGEIPLNQMVHLGGDHWLPAATAARWRELQRLAWEKYRVWLQITPGWNAYRPISVQRDYKRRFGNRAAAPGYSSHGGGYRGRDMMAIDVNNWSALGWGRFDALCRIVGFWTDFVSPTERWHIGDPNPWVMPVFVAIPIKPAAPAKPKPKPEPPKEEDEMRVLFGHRNIGGDEWMIVHPEFVGKTDKERGYLVTTSRDRARAWARMYKNGWAGKLVGAGGRYDFDVAREDYIEIQEAAREVHTATQQRLAPTV